LLSAAALTRSHASVLRTDSRFISAWQAVSRECQLLLSELLNTEKYPEGDRICWRPK
jgi:hypothetical protein